MNLYILTLTILTFLNACESVKNVDASGYMVKKRHILPSKIDETSGIIKHRGLIWTFNDSGGKPEIYGFNLSNDSIEQTITLANAINNDWEDIAQDNNYIYVGDFGNNQGTRDSLVVYKISKLSIPEKGNASVASEKIVFSYQGYEPVKMVVSWSAFDCEAFVSIKDSLYLFTKDWTQGTTAIYSLSKNAGKHIARKINSLNPEGLITGADFENNKLILIGYRNFVPFIIQYTTTDLKTLSDKKGTRFILHELSTYQTEGICFDGQRIYISSEKTRSPAQIVELEFK